MFSKHRVGTVDQASSFDSHIHSYALSTRPVLLTATYTPGVSSDKVIHPHCTFQRRN